LYFLSLFHDQAGKIYTFLFSILMQLFWMNPQGYGMDTGRVINARNKTGPRWKKNTFARLKAKERKFRKQIIIDAAREVLKNR